MFNLSFRSYPEESTQQRETVGERRATQRTGGKRIPPHKKETQHKNKQSKNKNKTNTFSLQRAMLFYNGYTGKFV